MLVTYASFQGLGSTATLKGLLRRAVMAGLSYLWVSSVFWLESLWVSQLFWSSGHTRAWIWWLQVLILPGAWVKGTVYREACWQIQGWYHVWRQSWTCHSEAGPFGMDLYVYVHQTSMKRCPGPLNAYSWCISPLFVVFLLVQETILLHYSLQW